MPGAAVDAVTILDSGSGITTMSAGIAHKLQAAFPDVQVVGGMTRPGKLKVADGRVLEVQDKTCPARIALNIHVSVLSTKRAIGISIFYCVRNELLIAV